MKRIYLSESYSIIDFDAAYINTVTNIIDSKGFESLLNAFYKSLKKNSNILLDDLKGVSVKDINNFYKMLLVYNLGDAISLIDKIKGKHIKPLYTFTESLYDYWRNLTRFGFLKGSKNYDLDNKVIDLINVTNDFNTKVISLYRTIAEKLLGSSFNVYRQLPAGINANMLYVKHKFDISNSYSKIQNIPMVTKIVTNPPFIIKSKSNTRSDLFTAIDFNPLSGLNINKEQFFAFPVMVGPLLAFVYIHQNYLHHGISLSNLFEFANYSDFKDKKPDMVFVYGILENEHDCKYYYDKDEDLYIGFVSQLDKNDYFGYLKKMLLTLHNVSMINKGNLPIHGAMVNIKLNNKTSKNVVIIGDSGAGKSETLEALRLIGKDSIKDMQVVFDDMGTFKMLNDTIYANGTEIGAFVRLDDLDTGYAYEIMDRALFLNPNQVNARVVIPISSYEFINENHIVDLVLYANNYDEENYGLELFESLDDSLKVFTTGTRKAKGTTSEVGLVSTFFANPFGPVQMEEETKILVNKYFNNLQDNKIKTGQIYTKLAVNGYESKGPIEAAKKLLEFLEKGVY